MARAILIQPSFYEAMRILPDGDRLQLFDAICEYSLFGVEPDTLSPVANSLFILMRPNIDSSNKRYQASIENGKKGGAPKGNQNAKKQPKHNPKTTKAQPKNKQDLDSDLDSDSDSDGELKTADKPPRAPRFSPPSVEAVRDFCQENGLSLVDPDSFVDFYSSKGWKVGSSTMKDWKSAARNWNRREQKEQAAKTVATADRIYTAADYLEGW